MKSVPQTSGPVDRETLPSLDGTVWAVKMLNDEADINILQSHLCILLEHSGMKRSLKQ